MRSWTWLAKLLRGPSSIRRRASGRLTHAPCSAFFKTSECLEPRTLLTGPTDADTYVENSNTPNFHPAETDFVIPQVTRLQNSSGFLTAPSDKPAFNIAIDFLHDRAIDFGLTPTEIDSHIVTDQYVSPHGATHIHLQQTVNNLPVANATISVNIAASGEVMNAVSSFVAGIGDTEASGGVVASPEFGSTKALAEFANEFGFELDSAPAITATGELFAGDQIAVLNAPGLSNESVTAQLHYVPTENGVELAWQFNVQTADGLHWYDASVSALDGDVEYVADWSHPATYQVFAAPNINPDETQRTIETDPFDATASPFGWHDTNGVAGFEFTTTRGNNVHAYPDRNGDNQPDAIVIDGGPTLDFQFPLDLNEQPDDYQPAATANVFYWANLLHDIHYHYGFDEAAGNFQFRNYTGAGRGGDHLLAEVQDGADLGHRNNANFATPPDGSSPRMQMFQWDRTNPNRDGDLDATIIIHEYSHGVSTRLTGGPANSNSLSANQSRSLGEGWSDWHALMLTQKADDTATNARGIGTYARGESPNGAGIRSMPYSYDMTINDHTFGDIGSLQVPHTAGEVWAATLWDLNWALIGGSAIDANLPKPGLGFDADFHTGTGGNNLAMQLIMDGMKLQGAQPTYLAARDAILLADQNLTGGEHQETIWTVFARRGMGLSASDSGDPNDMNVTEAFDIPPFHVATVQLDADNYSPGENIIATVDDTGVTTSTVDVTFTTSRGDSETLSLTDISGGNSERFSGAAPTMLQAGAFAADDGLLEIYFGDTITVSYMDPDDGSGGSIVVTETATVGAELSTERIEPAGSGIRSGIAAGQLSNGVTDVHRVQVSEGETLSFVVDPDVNVRPQIELRRNGQSVVTSQAAIAAGQTLLEQDVEIQPGTYDILVSDLDAIGGGYELHVAVNAGFEAEPFDGAINADSANAELLAFSPLEIGTGQIAAVRGRNSGVDDVDSYRINLSDGQGISVALAGAGATLDIVDSSNAVVASGSAANNLDHAISAFFDSTNDGDNDSYFLRVKNAADEYQLVVTRDAAFDVEPNNTSATAQNLESLSAVVGHLTSADSDFFAIPAFASSPVTIATSTPGDQLPGGLRNELNPQLRLYDQTGAELTFDTDSRDGRNAQLTYVSPVDTMLIVEVSAETDTGDYQLLIDRSLVPALVVDIGDGLIVSEDGTGDSFDISLTQQPASDVVLNIDSNSPHLNAQQQVTFTATNWNQPRTISINAVDNQIVDGSRTAALTISVDQNASDDEYDDVSSQILSATVSDDEIAGIIVKESDGSTVVFESGLTDSVAVSLSAEPLSDVLVVFAPADAGEVAVATTSLTFTPQDWNTPQSVVVDGVDDDAADGDVISSLVVSVDANGSDNLFDEADQTISVTTRDDEDDTVAVSLTVRELDTSPGIRVGELIEVDVAATDRLNNQAVRSAYFDLLFSNSHFAVTDISYNADYATDRNGTLNVNTGVITDLGASTDGTLPLDQTIVTVQLQAQDIGAAEISTSISSAPESAVLLFAPGPESDQRFDTIHDSITLEVLPNAAISLVIDDSIDGSPGLDPDETFHIHVHIRDLANDQPAQSGYVDVTFDPAFFQVNSILFDSDYTGGRTGTIDNLTGRIQDLGASTPSGVPADDRIATLEVRALQSGTSILGTERPNAASSKLLSFSAEPGGDLRDQASYEEVSVKVGQADLVSQFLLVNNSHLSRGQANLTYIVNNSGTGPAEPFQNHLVWSPNAVLGDSDDFVVPDSISTINGLDAGASRSVSLSLILDRAMLYAHSIAADPPGGESGTVSLDISHLFLVIDSEHAVEELDEANNTNGGTGRNVVPVTYFPWDHGGDGVVTPLDALRTLQAVGGNDSTSDFDGNGVVTPLEALGVIQRIGYRRAEPASAFSPQTDVVESNVLNSERALQATIFARATKQTDEEQIAPGSVDADLMNTPVLKNSSPTDLLPSDSLKDVLANRDWLTSVLGE